MLDLKWIRENHELLQAANDSRGIKMNIEKLLELDERRRKMLADVENLRSLRNVTSQEIAKLNKEGLDSAAKVNEMQEVGRKIKAGETMIEDLNVELDNILLYQPNVPLPDVPPGKSAEDNQVVRVWGDAPALDFEPKPHWELGEKLGIMDFAAAAKMTGARFCVMKGAGAKLERALINFMLETHTTKHGYTEILPPFLVNATAMMGTGQLPKFKEDLFCCEKEGFYLIPTAEVPVTNLHREEILKEEALPLCYTAYTPCFRSEAGSYGQDTRGLIRQHQFNKVELVKFTKPEESETELQKLLHDAEKILQLLGLPYRVIILCRGDMGFSAAKTYDIEVWLPSQKRYREISSCSTFTDFQARRAKIRFRRNQDKKTEFVHTLNGSGLAVGRTLVAILENYQTAAGAIKVPEVLRPLMGNLAEITGL